MTYSEAESHALAALVDLLTNSGDEQVRLQAALAILGRKA